MNRIAIACAALVALCAASAPAATPIQPPTEREKWIATRADEMEIISNASESTTVSVARQLLRMRAALGQLTQLKVRSPLPTKVYVFANERSFAPYRDAAFQRKSAQVTGAFLGGDDENLILIQADSGSGIDRIVFHELTHYFVKNTVRGLPLWFNEGLAEFYSTFDTSGDEVNIGRPIPEHVYWLRGQALIPLRELFAVDEKSPTYNEGTRQGVFYAESWALVHYLLRGNDARREQLGKFLGLVGSGIPSAAAASVAFHATYDELESELRAYVRRFSFPYMRYSGADLKVAEIAKPEPMTRDRVLYELGHLLAHSNAANAADAERFLSEAVRINPNLAAAHADLGRLMDISGRQADAQQEYERAVSLGSREADVYLLYGGSILDRLVRAGNPGEAPPAEIAKARQLLTKAAELDPNSARAWAGVGATYLAGTGEGDSAAGIAALEKSLALAPAQKDVAYYLVQLYARAGRREDAAHLVETVIVPNGDPDLVTRAREAVLLADVRRIESLLREEKIDEAVPLMKSVMSQTTQPDLKAHLAALLQQVDQYTSMHSAVDALRQATDKANAGQYAEALALIDGALPKITDAEMLAKAKQFREEVAKAAGRKKK